MAVCSGCLLAFSLGQDAYKYMELWPPLVVIVAPQDGDFQATVLARQGMPKITPGYGAAKDPIGAIGASKKTLVCEQIHARLPPPGPANCLAYG